MPRIAVVTDIGLRRTGQALDQPAPVHNNCKNQKNTREGWRGVGPVEKPKKQKKTEKTKDLDQIHEGQPPSPWIWVESLFFLFFLVFPIGLHSLSLVPILLACPWCKLHEGVQTRGHMPKSMSADLVSVFDLRFINLCQLLLCVVTQKAGKIIYPDYPGVAASFS